MNKKQFYTTPEVNIVRLQMEGAILSGSGAGATGTGSNVTYDPESDFNSFFN